MRIGRWIRTATVSVAALGLVSSNVVPAGADETERALGAKLYEQIKASGLILQGTRYNRIVDEIAPRIARAAQGMYDEPFRFYVIHASPPNAFAVPGGYMFIHDSLIDAVETKDELACVTGHEISHVIHHDTIDRLRRNQRNATIASIGAVLLGGGKSQAVNTVASTYVSLAALHYDRHQETAADITGSEICASAGYNPNGLVWMMEKFEKISAGRSGASLQAMEMFSNHPREDHRIADLQDHFAQNPTAFARYSADIARATPISASAVVGEPDIDCPSGERVTRSADDAVAWLDRGGSSWTGPVQSFAPLRVTDTIAAPSRANWMAFPGSDGSALIAYDPSTKLAVACVRRGTTTTFRVQQQASPPSFLIEPSDLGPIATSRGIRIGSPLSSLFAVYGRTAPVALADGSALYTYRKRSEGGLNVAMRFVVRDGRVTAFARETGI
ncbi:MAG: peptidase Ste24p [Candidatus Eremiobacteraeota bacterium]|nr:peptidase Ste24p [Candidatus Eremiobacteraeota bacterium]